MTHKSGHGVTTRVFVCGIGEAGGCIADTFVKKVKIKPVGIAAFNTNDKDLEQVKHIKAKYRFGLEYPGGIGGRWKLASKAAKNDMKNLWAIAHDANISDSEVLLFIVGFGGGTGSGSVPIIAEEFKNKYLQTLATRPDKPEDIIMRGRSPAENMLSLVIGALPFDFEPDRFKFNSACCITNLLTGVDGIVIVDNDVLKTRHDIREQIDARVFKDKINPLIAQALQSLASPTEFVVDYPDIQSTVRLARYPGIIVPCYADRKKNEPIADLVLRAVHDGALTACKPDTALGAIVIYNGRRVLLDEIEAFSTALRKHIIGTEIRWGFGKTHKESVLVLLVNPLTTKINSVYTGFADFVFTNFDTIMEKEAVSIIDLLRIGFQLIRYAQHVNKVKDRYIHVKHLPQGRGIDLLDRAKNVEGIIQFLMNKLHSADELSDLEDYGVHEDNAIEELTELLKQGRKEGIIPRELADSVITNLESISKISGKLGATFKAIEDGIGKPPTFQPDSQLRKLHDELSMQPTVDEISKTPSAETVETPVTSDAEQTPNFEPIPQSDDATQQGKSLRDTIQRIEVIDENFEQDAIDEETYDEARTRYEETLKRQLNEELNQGRISKKEFKKLRRKYMRW